MCGLSLGVVVFSYGCGRCVRWVRWGVGGVYVGTRREKEVVVKWVRKQRQRVLKI